MKPLNNQIVAKALKSAMLLLLTMFPISLLHVLFHEIGHAFVAFVYGETGIKLFIHPFAFSAYARPFLSIDCGIFHLAGPIAGILIPFLIFWIIRKQKSPATLFLRMLFPWSLLAEGLNTISVMTGTGDFYNFVSLTGIPSIIFAILGVLMILTGIVWIAWQLPQIGVPHGSSHALWIVPVGMMFWALISYLIGIILVPIADFVIQWQLQEEILLVSVMWIFITLVIGFLIGLTNVLIMKTKYHGVQQLVCELHRKDLIWPTIWFLLSNIIGIIWILA